MNHKVIDELIDAAPEQTAMLQLQTSLGPFSGAVRKTKHAGVYEMKMMAKSASGKLEAVQMFVDASIVGVVAVPTAEQVAATPGNGSGLHLPGRLS